MDTIHEFIARKISEKYEIRFREAGYEKNNTSLDQCGNMTPEIFLKIYENGQIVCPHVMTAKKDGETVKYFLKTSKTKNISEKEGYDKIKEVVPDNVPELLVCDEKNSCIIYDYIEGQNLSLFEPKNIGQTEDILTKVIEIQKAIHAQKEGEESLIHGDARTLNYIFNPKTEKVYIIDFDTTSLGNPFWDVLAFENMINMYMGGKGHEFYLDNYFDNMEKKREYMRWAKNKDLTDLPKPKWLLEEQGMKK
jgi:tRNA A-37 threonylcarbamoyl transferase component Bud32